MTKLLAEIYKPRDGKTRQFIDVHAVRKVKNDKAVDDDDHFAPRKPAVYDRTADRMGHNPGDAGQDGEAELGVRVADNRERLPIRAHEGVDESIVTTNKVYGFHGTSPGNQSNKARLYNNMAHRVQNHLETDAKTTVHFLDSPHGRHLAELMSGRPAPQIVQNFIKGRFKAFSATYDPKHFGESLDYGVDPLSESADVIPMNGASTQAMGAAQVPNTAAAHLNAAQRYLSLRDSHQMMIDDHSSRIGESSTDRERELHTKLMNHHDALTRTYAQLSRYHADEGQQAIRGGR